MERPQVKAFIKDEQQPLTKPTDQPLTVTAGFLVVGFSFCWLLKSLHYRYHSSHILRPLSVLLIGWVVEGCKPCQIKHSSWPAIDSDLFIWYLKHRGGSRSNTVYASLCRFMCGNWETISKRQFVMSITWGSRSFVGSVDARMFKQQRLRHTIQVSEIASKKWWFYEGNYQWKRWRFPS